MFLTVLFAAAGWTLGPGRRADHGTSPRATNLELATPLQHRDQSHARPSSAVAGIRVRPRRNHNTKPGAAAHAPRYGSSAAAAWCSLFQTKVVQRQGVPFSRVPEGPRGRAQT